MSFPTTSSAYGIWSLKEQRDAVRGSNWPSVAINVEYLVIAGGGGGGNNNSSAAGGGGGAGGYRSSVSGESSGANSSAESVFTATAGTA